MRGEYRLIVWVCGACLAAVFAATASASTTKVGDSPPASCPIQTCTGIAWDDPQDSVIDIPVPPELGGQSPTPPSSNGSAQQTVAPSVSPQVPTPPTQGRSGAVGAEPPAPAPYDACRNVDGIQPSVPLGQIRSDEGDCVYPPVNNAGMCLKDQFILTPVPQMAAGLAAKQQMALWVEGTGLVCWISDLVTYHSDPRFYVFAGYVGLGGPTDGPGGNGIYNSQSPYENWMLYPYWRKMTDAEHALAVTKRAKKRH
jgi:hypothetical protein